MSSIDVTKRLKKYLDTKLFDKSFTLYPDDKKIVIYKKERKNLFYINENYNFAFLDIDNTISSNKEEKSNYQKWFFNYLKFYLFANLTNDQLSSFLEINRVKINEVDKFIEIICSMDIENLINDHI